MERHGLRPIRRRRKACARRAKRGGFPPAPFSVILAALAAPLFNP